MIDKDDQHARRSHRFMLLYAHLSQWEFDFLQQP